MSWNRRRCRLWKKGDNAHDNCIFRPMKFLSPVAALFSGTQHGCLCRITGWGICLRKLPKVWDNTLWWPFSVPSTMISFVHCNQSFSFAWFIQCIIEFSVTMMVIDMSRQNRGETLEQWLMSERFCSFYVFFFFFCGKLVNSLRIM